MKHSIALIRKHLSYNPITGLFRWKFYRQGRRRNLIAGGIDLNGYLIIKFLGQPYKGHILAWVFIKGHWPKKWIDHKNLKRADNRWHNLRLSTRGQNKQNGRHYKNNKAGIKGVHLQDGRWRADIQYEGKQYYLGMFATSKEAAATYKRESKKHHKEFARS